MESDGSRSEGETPAVWDRPDITVSDGERGEGKCLLVTATSSKLNKRNMMNMMNMVNMVNMLGRGLKNRRCFWVDIWQEVETIAFPGKRA